ncbi:hypothetical protein GVN21_14955 [Caulobacter sp. SLTY]|uniref:hypothetical protein n=1 Tax=Caulobacter sp. SLTY TaxID=2683262 RepID=UPI001413468B|nr:hypothetical protein [Caulobacter sp. SLTY]NBB16661.1 hypothetical protein [Caulobacter sp. SLTY]
MKHLLTIAALAAFAVSSAGAAQPVPADQFFAQLTTLCGKAFEGKVVTTDPLDKDFEGKRLVMKVAVCTDKEIRIPFAVGEDRSRTWVISRIEMARLRLKHDHRHKDGTEDALSQYGGDSVTFGSAFRQEFPADAFSKTLFKEKGNPASVTNVWAVEVHPGKTYAYELRRENRFFRVEFDLTKPLAD